MSQHDRETDERGGSRRSFMKKGALTATALALGVGAGTTNATAQDGQIALTFAYDYFPNQEFEVVDRLQQQTTTRLLQIDDEVPAELGDASDWRGHIIRYQAGGQSTGETGFVFLREQTLSQGDTATVGTDASMYSSELNLLSFTLNGGGEGNNGAVVEEDEEQEEQPEEEQEETPEEEQPEEEQPEGEEPGDGEQPEGEEAAIW